MSLLHRHAMLSGYSPPDQEPSASITLDDLDIPAEKFFGDWLEIHSTYALAFSSTTSYSEVDNDPATTWAEYAVTIPKNGRYTIQYMGAVGPNRQQPYSARVEIQGETVLLDQHDSGSYSYDERYGGVVNLAAEVDATLTSRAYGLGPPSVFTIVDGIRLSRIPADSFVMLVNAEQPSDTFTLPIVNQDPDITVDWGDGTRDTITSLSDPNLTHTYPATLMPDAADWPNIRQITIWGTIPEWSFNIVPTSKNKVIATVNYAGIFDTLHTAFDDCVNMVAAIVDNNIATSCAYAWRNNKLTTFDTSSLTSVTDCYQAWYGNALTTFDSSGLTSVTDCFEAWTINALDEASVDGIIDVLADNIKEPGFAVGLDGGTNAPPSAAAQLRIDNELTPAGYTVSTN